MHSKHLPGSPDLVLRKFDAVIFINGCFWHRHRCDMFRWPKSNREFWRNKLEGNARRDKRNIDALRNSGWRVYVVWECSLRGPNRETEDDVILKIEKWLVSGVR